MKKIKEVIVVEGKNDTNVLKSYFECDTIETHGSCLSKKTIKLIEEAQRVRGVIIFTDSDSPGEKIRTIINQQIKGCKNAFVAKEKSRTDKKVGIEHANKNDLEQALEMCVTFDFNEEKGLSLQDLVELGLTGDGNSKKLRKAVGEILNIGEVNTKTFQKRCQMLGVKKEKIVEIIKQCKANKE